MLAVFERPYARNRDQSLRQRKRPAIVCLCLNHVIHDGRYTARLATTSAALTPAMTSASRWKLSLDA